MGVEEVRAARYAAVLAVVEVAQQRLLGNAQPTPSIRS